MSILIELFSFYNKFVSAITALLCGFFISQIVLAPPAFGQNSNLIALVLINAQNATGYNPDPQSPGEFQRFAERYLEHLQIPYETIDVATQTPPVLSDRHLIISAHRGLNLSAAWQIAITDAVELSGVGFVNLDWDASVGQQLHLQDIFGATGSGAGAPGSAITVPQNVLQDGTAPHFIAGLQTRFRNDPPGDIVYNFHPDANQVLQTVTSTVLTGAAGTVIARIGTNPLILATTFGAGRAVHFGTLEYLRADRFGFMMGLDDLFWRSLVWAARKPFVVRGFPRLWSVQMDDTLPGWSFRAQDMYDTSLTGVVAADDTGGPWRVTEYVFTNNVAPGSADRATAIADINAGNLQISPHSRTTDFGTLYWEDLFGQELTDSSWLLNIANIQNWMTGNGGADQIPFISRSMVPHFWNLSDLTGQDMWDTLGVRYVTEIQTPGIDFFSKTEADRPRLRPFRQYELPPFSSQDENYPIYIADDYTVNSRSGEPPQTFFNFTTQIIDLNRYDRQDLAWPNDTRPVEETIDQFQYYTWRLWSGLAPVQIYTHDGSSNYILSTPEQRQEVIQQVSTWLNARGVRHVFMEDLGDYMYARTNSVLTTAQLAGTDLTLTFSGNAATADSDPIDTEFLYFDGDNEGVQLSVPGFTGGATEIIDISGIVSNPTPTTNGLVPNTTLAGGAGFTLTVNGTDFISTSVVRWNGLDRTTTFVSATELQAAITAADIASAGTAAVTVFNPAPSGGTSNPQTFTITGNPVPVTTSINPATAVAGDPGFTLTVNGTDFVPTSVVQWDGANRPTTFVSSMQLTANITAADIALVGTADVTVLTPTPGGGTSNAQNCSIVAPGGTFFDDFNRPNTTALGNGWIEKNPAAFSLAGNAVSKAATSTGYRDNLVYRPASELILNGEASVEVRFASLPPGYAQLLVRGQMDTIAAPDDFDGYLLFIDNSPTRAFLGRIESGAFVLLAQLNLNPGLNTTDTFRLRLRATGTNPVVVEAFVERFTGTTWAVIGQATVNDAAATRFATAGTVGFTGYVEGGVYTYDNFIRTSFDGGALNPVPVTSGLTPPSATAGNPGFTLTVSGTNFIPTSVVRWNGADRGTTFVSATELTAAITAADVATAGTASVTVFNPAPGGGPSNAQTFTITASGNPVPVITALNPPSANAGASGFTLSVTGSDFLNGSIVRWNGANRATTFVSATELQASIPAADIATAGTAAVTVFTPAPGGGTSNAQTFTITASGSFVDNFNRPNAAALGNGWIEKNPAAFAVAGNVVTKAATGTGFADNLVCRPASEVMLAGEASVEVRFTSLPPGYAQVFVRGQTATIANAGVFNGYLLFIDGVQNRALLNRIENGAFIPLATLVLNPVLNTTDTFRLRLRATGTNPVVLEAFVERFTGTTWAVIGQATVNDAAATRFATAGTVGFTGYVEGGVYTYDNFIRTSFDGGALNPVPVTSGLTPPSATAGNPGFTLTVSGTNFIPTSVVRWNGQDRATTFVSATELTAAIPAADIATAGTASVTVFNPAPGGGTSNPQTFTITASGNPVPVITALNPTSANAGGAGFTLSVTGSNFLNGSIVRWNGADRATTFVSATELQATIPAANITTPGTAQVTVFTPAPGGGTSNAQTFTITASGSFVDDFNRPNAAALGNGWIEKNPAAFSLAGNAVTKAATGTGFADNLVYRPASEVMLAGEASVEVRFTSLPPGYAQVFVRGQTATIANAGVFNGYLLFIDGVQNRALLNRIENGAFIPLATLVLNPVLNTTDTFRLRLRATGTNPVVVEAFVERFTGTTWAVIGQATVNDAAATRFATAGTVGFTGYIEGGVYTYDNFTRTNLDGEGSTSPVPTSTGITPNSATSGGAAFTLTVDGTNFVANSVVRWNGQDRATTFVSATELTAAIPAADIATAGTASVTVFNPAPGGGTSNPQTFTITTTTNPVPTTTSLNPSTALAGGASFTLTVNGTNFVGSSVVRWNGQNRATTFVSTTQLRAMISGADLGSAGTVAVTVFNPAPGGGSSTAQSFTIIPLGGTFTDNFDRPDNADVGNNWTEKFPAAFSIQNNEVINFDTGVIDYHDAIVYRPVTEDQRDMEVGIEFRTLPGQNFPQVHARVQRNTITQANTLEGYLMFVDGFEPSPGRAIIARQAPVPGQFECYMLAIPFPSPLQQTDRYRLRFRVAGANPVTLEGFIDRLNGSTWQVFASGAITHNNTGTIPPRDPNLFCDPGFLGPPISTMGAVGFAKWQTNNEVLDNFFWTNLSGVNPVPTTTGLTPSSATAGGAGFSLTVNGTNFVANSVVRWNGQDRATTFVSATQLLATIPATDIASAGTAQVTVLNPAPAGGTSNAQTFTISASPSPPEVTVTFDNPVPPGNSGSLLSGIFEGIDFGTNQWRWEGTFGPNPTNHIFFHSAAGTSRTFQFAGGPRVLERVRVFVVTAGTLTLSDNQGQSVSQAMVPGTLTLIQTGWTQAATTITVAFTAGWDLGLDDITYRE